MPTDRLNRVRRGSGAPQDDETPFALVEKQGGAQRLYALTLSALRQGLSLGLSLADARARLPQLVVAEADRTADAKTLALLAARCERYTPLTALDEPHGLILDVTGCAHLFGGEAGLLKRLRQDVDSLGFCARAALATAPDCARALARFSAGGIFAPEEEAAAVARLPLAALETEEEILVALNRAGLKTLGDVAARSSRAFTSRFGADFSRRIERLFGREDVRIKPLRPPPDCMVERHFPEPLAQRDQIEAALRDLMLETALLLERRGQGGRVFETVFFRADGAVRRLQVRLCARRATPKSCCGCSRKNSMLWPIRSIPVSVLTPCASPCRAPKNFVAEQADFAGAAAVESERELSELLDRLTTRFGRERVLRFVHCDTHEPERETPAVPAALAQPASSSASRAAPAAGEPPLRPLTLFDPPQPVEVLALAPDGPPARFRWRRQAHDVLRAEGPERIAPEWTQLDPAQFGPEAPTRDYYRVEDVDGCRFWLFRRGLYERGDETPCWFVHGLFA